MESESPALSPHSPLIKSFVDNFHQAVVNSPGRLKDDIEDWLLREEDQEMKKATDDCIAKYGKLPKAMRTLEVEEKPHYRRIYDWNKNKITTPPPLEEGNDWCTHCKEDPCVMDQFSNEFTVLADGLLDDNTKSHKQKRFACYRYMNSLLFGHLGKGNRKPNPLCVMREVHDAFPESDGKYVDIPLNR